MKADPLRQLVRLLSRLPGIGEKTGTRLAFHILKSPTAYAEQLSASILAVKQHMGPCSVCGHLTDADPCSICSDATRESQKLCIVALPQDLMAIERTGSFRGRYHVLNGVLSPLDGIGPDALNIRSLLQRLGPENIDEVILATSPSVEGDATALYLAGIIKPLSVRVTRIASGIPIGGELEYADGVTLNRALETRREV